jgi:hypothetical protein
MKELYIQSYKDLAMHYLDKKDANEYLARYATKVDGIYLPKDEQTKEFVEYYYARYKEIGQQTIQI